MHISPVSSRGNEVETDMDATVLHCLSDHSTLCVEKLFKQRVDVLCDWLPAKRRRREEEEGGGGGGGGGGGRETRKLTY